MAEILKLSVRGQPEHAGKLIGIKSSIPNGKHRNTFYTAQLKQDADGIAVGIAKCEDSLFIENWAVSIFSADEVLTIVKVLLDQRAKLLDIHGGGNGD